MHPQGTVPTASDLRRGDDRSVGASQPSSDCRLAFPTLQKRCCGHPKQRSPGKSSQKDPRATSPGSCSSSASSSLSACSLKKNPTVQCHEPLLRQTSRLPCNARAGSHCPDFSLESFFTCLATTLVLRTCGLLSLGLLIFLGSAPGDGLGRFGTWRIKTAGTCVGSKST